MRFCNASRITRIKSEEKAVYMEKALQVQEEHKRKYPNYRYYPKDARIQKALRVECSKKAPNKKGPKATAALPGSST
jgi:hypothetical protein